MAQRCGLAAARQRRPNHFGKPSRNCLLTPGYAENRQLRLSIVALVIPPLQALHREATGRTKGEGHRGPRREAQCRRRREKPQGGRPEQEVC